MFMKLIEFVITFLTIRKIVEDIKDETTGTETNSGRGGDQPIPGDLYEYPESVREDGTNINNTRGG
tara:strand:- start:892 stop:1089 length:198 start_codon:yes stop_codon:yes gene_type:complete